MKHYIVEEWDKFQGGWWILDSFDTLIDAGNYYDFICSEKPFNDFRIVYEFLTNKDK